LDLTQNTSNPLRIALGIITYKRPQMLQELLESIASQSIFQRQDVKVELVLVDNDPASSALSQFEQYRSQVEIPAFYYTEKRRGIPYARNTVLEHAKESGVDFVAFIDDDEVAAQDWLEQLFDVLTSLKVDGVQGPVVNRLPVNAPRWAEKVYGKQKHLKRNEGECKAVLSTNNVLFSMRLVTDCGLAFDEVYAQSGGSDADFFLRASRLGSTHVWTNRAIVYETVPISRLTQRWQFQRTFRGGAGNTFMYVRQHGVLAGIRRYWLKIPSRIVFGLIILASAGLFSGAIRILAIRRIASGVGHLSGFFGVLGSEYTKTHGN
jgi:succinoglycan biosynthesis protein ExoM